MYISESTLRRLRNSFWANLCSRSVLEAPPSHLQLQSGEKGGKKLLKWPPVKPIGIVLLIANAIYTQMYMPFWKTFSANQSCSFNCIGHHFLGRTVFRVGMRPTFLRNDSETYLERSPGTTGNYSHRNRKCGANSVLIGGEWVEERQGNIIPQWMYGRMYTVATVVYYSHNTLHCSYIYICHIYATYILPLILS